MKALLILSLVSVASATVAIIDPKTPEVHKYKHDEGNTHDAILMAPLKVVARHSDTQETPYGTVHVKSWDSYYNGDGVTTDDLKKVARNLDDKFVETIVDSEKNMMMIENCDEEEVKAID